MESDVDKIIFLQNFKTDSGAHLASYLYGSRSSFSGSKAAGNEADHSAPSNSEFKTELAYTATPTYVKGQFSLYL
jgi:hypothetical protein